MKNNFLNFLINGFNNKIIAKNREHLYELITHEIIINGPTCNLNHIDVSRISNMVGLFNDNNLYVSHFNGDISQWDVSNVENMEHMFYKSSFNGDISNWNTSKVKTMHSMFLRSKFDGDISRWDVSNVNNMVSMFSESAFNGDISKWDVSNVHNMASMFYQSVFNGDISHWDVSKVEDMMDMFSFSEFKENLSNWKPYNLDSTSKILENCNALIPYWAKIEDQKTRNIAIDNYWLKKELSNELIENNNQTKKIKI